MLEEVVMRTKAAVSSLAWPIIGGAMNGPNLTSYVERSLAPTQQNGDIVFMDNLHTHKVAGRARSE